MTAQVIQFPRKKLLQAHELPDYWTDRIKQRYIHAALHEPHDEAFCFFDAVAKFRPIREGESEADYCLHAEVHAAIALYQTHHAETQH